MSRESKFITDIISKTESSSVRWINIQPSRYAEYVFQGHLAYQAFEAEAAIEKKKYKLVLVHKKVPSHNTDFEMVEEKHATDLLVFREGRLVSTLTAYEIDDRLMDDLAEAVAAKNDDTDELFDAYE